MCSIFFIQIAVSWVFNEGYRWSAFCNFVDQDINPVLNKTFDQCIQACKENDLCTHFDFYFNRNECHLKYGSPGEPNIKNNARCGIVYKVLVININLS